MDLSYRMKSHWNKHGEKQESGEKLDNEATKDETYNLFQAAYFIDEELVQPIPINEPSEHGHGDEFIRRLEEAQTPLYPGCESYTKLSAIVDLYGLKGKSGLSSKHFNELLGIIKRMLPKDNVLLDSAASIKSFLKIFDMGYEKIHACVNDCCLFRKKYEELDNCPTCGASRWKINKRSKEIRKGVPVKVLRYFPIIPRFKRMFRSSQMAKDLRWHFDNKSTYGKMRHPVDSLAWDLVNDKWPSFAADPRNLRLGLSTDGFNSFSILSSKYSCWPVMLVNYNLPPMLCMKKDNIMLTLLIPGPKQPGNDIDIYLQPLVDDLQLLWENGVEAYDAFSKSTFNLKTMLMWTINDFPTYGNLAGCSTKGRKACPICGKNTHHRWLRFSKKFSYMGHRKFLKPSHPYRRKKSWFDNSVEHGSKPRALTGHNISAVLNDFPNDFGKGGDKKRKRNNNENDGDDDEDEDDTSDIDNQNELTRWNHK
ncbi:uncharacterized protein LOC109846048 [Asparagus officinalis]|uniref:uncharacterized protein LOC109846048 n=1 Tax=Asparagus officinalis TaxID=4686 RepID=UPI00098DF231|nr:uncharacterized protein LOC109846048 [Asparagus officinalis]